MEPFDFPPHLADVERQLAERGQPQPTAAFRQRVLSAMRDEAKPRRNIWRFATTLAASVFLCLNLVLSLANHQIPLQGQRIEGEDREVIVRAMRQRHPDLSEQEAYEFVVLLRSAPALPASLIKRIAWEGEESWDMR